MRQKAKGKRPESLKAGKPEGAQGKRRRAKGERLKAGKLESLEAGKRAR
jgi:hypothetical protein